MKLLQKTFQRTDCTYCIMGGEKVYNFQTCVEKIDLPGGGRKTWIITRSVDPSKIGHYISCTVKSSSDISCGFHGKTLTKLYSDDKKFEAAILRIEKLAAQKQPIAL